MKTILIVEDDAVVVQIYRKKFLREGFRVEVAEDGLEAMRQLPAVKPDLVMLDLMMPKFNGADVLKFIRSNKELKTTKVVIFSNAYMTDLAQEAAKAGADKSLLKSSCTPTQVLSVVKDLLGIDTAESAGVVPLAAPAVVTPKAPSQPALSLAPTEPEKTATTRAPAAQPTADPDLEARARQDFLANANVTLASMRDIFETFAKADDSQVQAMRLVDIYRKVHFLTDLAGVAGCHQIAHLSSALEALLFELRERPKNITPSVLQTIRSTIEFLGVLFSRADPPPEGKPLTTSVILVVDDDAICNRALVHALGRTNLKSTSTHDPVNALKLLQKDRYDLVLLDYLMPEINGAELCERMRDLPTNRQTPVIFVTSQTDFRQQAQRILARGDDVITKPIFPIELAVKALTHLLKRQLLEQISKL